MSREKDISKIIEEWNEEIREYEEKINQLENEIKGLKKQGNKSYEMVLQKQLEMGKFELEIISDKEVILRETFKEIQKRHKGKNIDNAKYIEYSQLKECYFNDLQIKRELIEQNNIDIQIKKVQADYTKTQNTEKYAETLKLLEQEKNIHQIKIEEWQKRAIADRTAYSKMAGMDISKIDFDVPFESYLYELETNKEENYNNLLWNREEFQAAVDYKGEGYNFINVLLSDNVTTREKTDKLKYFPKTPEEFQNYLTEIVNLYSAIRKNYTLNRDKIQRKNLFRGGRTGKKDMSFLSTSDSLKTALEFVRESDTEKYQQLLMIIDYKNVPHATINKLVPEPYGLDEEPEILFLPSEINGFEEIKFEECLKISNTQGEKIDEVDKAIEKYKSLKCGKVTLQEQDYSHEKTNLSIEDLSEMFVEYQKNLQVIRTLDKNCEQYNISCQEIINFKKLCHTWIHQKFHEVKLEMNNIKGIENDSISLSSEYDIEKVFLGNTGDMYQIENKQDGQEYYFKPAISKDGNIRPYRAYIQEAAYSIQKIINPENAVKCNSIEIDDMFGSIQEKILIDKQKTSAFKNYFNGGIGKLPPEIIKQIMSEYLVDYCLCNYDSHARNFVIDEKGNLRGIDKEQSFRYIDEDKNNDMEFSTNYNEQYGEDPSIYKILFQKMRNGEIPTNEFHEYFEEIQYRASRLTQYPDEQYRKIFEQYAYTKTKTKEEAEILLDTIVSRKDNILQNVQQLQHEILNERSRNKIKNSVSKSDNETEKKQSEKKIIFGEQEIGKATVNVNTQTKDKALSQIQRDEYEINQIMNQEERI